MLPSPTTEYLLPEPPVSNPVFWSVWFHVLLLVVPPIGQETPVEPETVGLFGRSSMLIEPPPVPVDEVVEDNPNAGFLLEVTVFALVSSILAKTNADLTLSVDAEYQSKYARAMLPPVTSIVSVSYVVDGYV
jgi:hypothetical protein